MHTVRFYANYYQHNSIQYVLYMQQNFMPLTNSIISFILQILLQYMYVYIYIYIYIYIYNLSDDCVSVKLRVTEKLSY